MVTVCICLLFNCACCLKIVAWNEKNANMLRKILCMMANTLGQHDLTYPLGYTIAYMWLFLWLFFWTIISKKLCWMYCMSQELIVFSNILCDISKWVNCVKLINHKGKQIDLWFWAVSNINEPEIQQRSMILIVFKIQLLTHSFCISISRHHGSSIISRIRCWFKLFSGANSLKRIAWTFNDTFCDK